MKRLLRNYTTAHGPAKPLRNVCVANRGEIVERVNRTANRMGIKTTSVYTEPDRDLPSALSNPVNVCLSDTTSGYIDIERVVAAAKSAGCDAIHPGYGFLSENAQFAKRVREEGLVFVGPPQAAIEAMGAKDRSKEIMEAAGVPVVPGYHGANQDPAVLEAEADAITYPVLIKAVLGGGGKGMRIVERKEDFAAALESAKSEARSSFGDERVLVEKYIKTPRHIEVQVFADRHGNVVALGERDCSVQRRHQKVLEESPAPGLDESVRSELWAKARDAARAVGYEGAGTVEFIFDNDTSEFYFMEMNTRLQVEHPVTEAVVGEDLVEWQLLVAAGFPLPKTQDEIQVRGHAFEARIYCEDPFQGFLPSSGEIVHMRTPVTGDPRLDFTFREKSVISALYDPMVGKLIVHGANRTEALARMVAALSELEIAGPTTNIEFLRRVCLSPDFGSETPRGLETGFIPKHPELMAPRPTPARVFAQAALGELLAHTPPAPTAGSFGRRAGWSTTVRHIDFSTARVSVEEVGKPGHAYTVTVVRKDSDGGPSTPEVLNVRRAAYNPSTRQLVISFDDAQFANSVVVETDRVHVFDDGVHYALPQPAPEWLANALGIKDTKHSVVAPMPCTIARVTVAPGDTVKKDQELLVILSMKMETTIRAPKDGVIKRIPHGAGEIVKQGVELVEFEHDD